MSWKAMRSKLSFDVQNALQVGTESEGGYLVPDEFERTLVEALEEENIFRQIANVITTSSGDKKIPVVASKGTASWVDEEGQIPESDDSFAQVSIGAYKLATMIKVSEELLNDSVFNLEQYIAKEFARRIGAKEEEAFFVGDGSGKPTGILANNGGGEGQWQRLTLRCRRSFCFGFPSLAKRQMKSYRGCLRQVAKWCFPK